MPLRNEDGVEGYREGLAWNAQVDMGEEPMTERQQILRGGNQEVASQVRRESGKWFSAARLAELDDVDVDLLFPPLPREETDVAVVEAGFASFVTPDIDVEDLLELSEVEEDADDAEVSSFVSVNAVACFDCLVACFC